MFPDDNEAKSSSSLGKSTALRILSLLKFLICIDEIHRD